MICFFYGFQKVLQYNLQCNLIYSQLASVCKQRTGILAEIGLWNCGVAEGGVGAVEGELKRDSQNDEQRALRSHGSGSAFKIPILMNSLFYFFLGVSIGVAPPNMNSLVSYLLT